MGAFGQFIGAEIGAAACDLVRHCGNFLMIAFGAQCGKADHLVGAVFDEVGNKRADFLIADASGEVFKLVEIHCDRGRSDVGRNSGGFSGNCGFVGHVCL